MITLALLLLAASPATEPASLYPWRLAAGIGATDKREQSMRISAGANFTSAEVGLYHEWADNDDSCVPEAIFRGFDPTLQKRETSNPTCSGTDRITGVHVGYTMRAARWAMSLGIAPAYYQREGSGKLDVSEVHQDDLNPDAEPYAYSYTAKHKRTEKGVVGRIYSSLDWRVNRSFSIGMVATAGYKSAWYAEYGDSIDATVSNDRFSMELFLRVGADFDISPKKHSLD